MEQAKDGSADHSLFIPISYDSILAIVQLLNAATRVRLSMACHASKECMSDPNCWRTCSFQRQPNVPDAAIRWCSQFMADCRTLDISNCARLTAHSIQYLLSNNCTNLRDLKFRGASGIGRDSSVLPQFLRACTALSSIVMDDSNMSNGRWAAVVATVSHLTSLLSIGNSKLDSALVKLTPASRLRHLDLTGCYNVSAATLISFFTDFQATSLDWLSLKGIPNCFDRCLIALAQNPWCSTLGHLDLSGNIAITDAGMSLLGSKLCNLKSLTCKGLGLVNDSCWATALASWPQMVQLDLTGCATVGAQALKSIGTVCTGLKHLNLTNCDVDNDNILHLQGCIRLEILELSCCNRVTSLGSLFPWLSRLQTIALVGLHRIDWASLFQDLVVNCHNITKLDLAQTQVEDSHLDILSHASFLHRFTHLSLQYCTRISDEAVLSPSSFVQQVLAHRDHYSDGQKFALNICGCTSVTNEALKKLRQQFVDNQVHPKLHLRCRKDLRRPGQGGCSCTFKP